MKPLAVIVILNEGKDVSEANEAPQTDDLLKVRISIPQAEAIVENLGLKAWH